jgi:hypothetical protein
MTLSKRQRNTLAPIARLPVELLVVIFKLAIKIVSEEDDNDHERQSPSLLSLTLSHVSHAWRNLALSCEQLWTNVDVRHRDLAVHCIARSGDQPLHVVLFSEGNEPPFDLDSDTESPFSALECAVNNSNRIETFTIHIPDPGEEEFYAQINYTFGSTAPTMPALQRLVVSLIDTEGCMPENRVDVYPLFVKGTSAYSQLRDLRIIGGFVPPHCLKSLQLVTLMIPRDSEFEHSPPEAWHHALEHLGHTLEELELDSAAFTMISENDLLMPRLTRLTLRGRLQANIHAWRCIRACPALQVTLDAFYDRSPTTYTTWQLVAHTICQQWPLAKTEHTISICCTSGDTITMSHDDTVGSKFKLSAPKVADFTSLSLALDIALRQRVLCWQLYDDNVSKNVLPVSISDMASAFASTKKLVLDKAYALALFKTWLMPNLASCFPVLDSIHLYHVDLTLSVGLAFDLAEAISPALEARGDVTIPNLFLGSSCKVSQSFVNKLVEPVKVFLEGRELPRQLGLVVNEFWQGSDYRARQRH